MLILMQALRLTERSQNGGPTLTSIEWVGSTKRLRPCGHSCGRPPMPPSSNLWSPYSRRCGRAVCAFWTIVACNPAMLVLCPRSFPVPLWPLHVVEFVGAGIKTQETSEEDVVLDLDIDCALACNFVLSLSKGPLTAKVRVTDLHVAASVRLVLGPLVNCWPCFNTLSVRILARPRLDLAVQALGLSPFNLPFLRQVLIEAILDNLPEKIDIPLLELTEAQRRKQDLQPKGVLRITLLEAKELRNAEVIGKSSPFCQLQLAQAGRESKEVLHSSIQANTLNPTWNESFEFVVTDLTDERLILSFKHADAVANTLEHMQLGLAAAPVAQIVNLLRLTALGDATLPLKDLQPHVCQDLWLPINASTGSARVLVEYKPFLRLDEKAPFNWAAHKGLQAPNDPFACCVLFATLVRGSHFAPDENVNALYCKLRVGKRQAKSKLAKNTTSPRWDEVFSFPIHDPATQQLRLTLKAKNSLTSAVIGELSVRISDVARSGHSIRDAFSLHDAKHASARVHMMLELRWLELSPGTLRRLSASHLQRSFASPPLQGELTVLLHSARELIAGDSDGFSDPFVRFTVGSATAQSSIVKRTLDAKYDSERFVFKIRDVVRDALQVSVFDWDRVGSDDLLGDCCINLVPFIGKGAVRSFYTLAHAPHGKVELTLEIKLDSASEEVYQRFFASLLQQQEQQPQQQSQQQQQQQADSFSQSTPLSVAASPALTVALPPASAAAPVPVPSPTSSRVPVLAVPQMPQLTSAATPPRSAPSTPRGGNSSSVQSSPSQSPAQPNRSVPGHARSQSLTVARPGTRTLFVTVRKATLAMDAAKLDPFVKLSTSKTTVKTQHKHKTNSPVFEESFRLDVGEKDQQLKVSIKSWHRLGSNDRLGQAFIPLQELAEQQGPVEREVQFVSGGVQQGTVLLSIELR